MFALLYRTAGIACLAGLLAGCALLPPEGVTNPAKGGIDATIAEFGVAPLDPLAPTPLLRQLRAELAKTDPAQHLAKITYSLSQGNRLPRDWLVQTPNVWGLAAGAVPFIPLDCPGCDADFALPACDPSCPAARCRPLAASVVHAGQRPKRFCLGHSDWLLDRIYTLVASAEHVVDITFLQPPADHRFLAALRNAVTRLAESGRAVTIRVMVGDYPPDDAKAQAYIKELLRDAFAVRRARLAVYVGTTRSCEPTECGSGSWNHAKIIAVDGKRALVGGHNMWTQDYLLDAPVHDLSMEIEGPAVRAAHRFADALWNFVCSQNAPGGVNESYGWRAGGEIGTACLAHLDLPPASAAPGRLEVLGVGRLASGILPGFVDQSQLARTLSFGAARQSVRMVQQDVAFGLPGLSGIAWPDSDLERLTDLLASGGEVFVVLSNLGAKGPVGGYSNGVPIERVGAYLRTLLLRRHPMDDEKADALLCAHLHLAPLRFGPDASWPDNRPIGVHAKFWMVDDRLFYIGSENLYPADLQEFGYIIDDRAAAAEIHRDYWDKLWAWSQRAAVSGAEAPRCMFRHDEPEPNPGF